MTRQRERPRRIRVTRGPSDRFEIVMAESHLDGRRAMILTDIEAHMLYVKLAIAFGYTTEAVEAATDDEP